jgi:hypothetical protein
MDADLTEIRYFENQKTKLIFGVKIRKNIVRSKELFELSRLVFRKLYKLKYTLI